MKHRVLLLALFLFSQASVSKQYGYHESTPFYLGKGFDPFDLSEGYPVRCVIHDGETRQNGVGVPQSTVDFKTIHSQKELFHELGFSSEIVAQSYFGSGKVGVSYVEESKFFDDSLTWMIVGKIDYGFFQMKNPRLSVMAKAFIDEGKHDAFAKRCGTHFISEEQRGERIFAIYTLHNVTQTQKSQLETMLKAQANFWVVSGGIDAEFQKSFAEALRSSQLEFHLYATGGKGIVDLSHVITDASDIKKVQAIVRDYAKKMTVDLSVPTAYVAGSMARFGFEDRAVNAHTKRDWALSEYYFLLSEAKQVRKRLQTILEKRKSYYKFLTDEEIDYYREARKKRKTDIERLFNDASSCYANVSACVFPDVEWDPIEWPEAKIGECERFRLRAREMGLITTEKLEEMRSADLVPILTPSLKKIMTWIRCEELENASEGEKH